jgi:hypothetical protein
VPDKESVSPFVAGLRVYSILDETKAIMRRRGLYLDEVEIAKAIEDDLRSWAEEFKSVYEREPSRQEVDSKRQELSAIYVSPFRQKYVRQAQEVAYEALARVVEISDC